MDSNPELFKLHLKSAVEKFNSIDRKECIRIISHYDTDGITACAILVQALMRKKRNFCISIVKQLTKDTIKSLAKENYGHYIFTDLGATSLSLMEEHLSSKNIIILDHHMPEKIEAGNNITHLNSHLFGVDGGKDIAGSGVVYTFAKELDPGNKDLAYLAVVGAIGDCQERCGFTGVNHNILKESVNYNQITVREGLRIFGAETRPLYKVLATSVDPYIPGITGNEENAISFLNELGISYKIGNDWRKPSSLTDEEMKRLAAGVIMKRAGEEDPEDVFGYTYIIKKQPKESPLRDAREFSTLLNSCGRMNKGSLGIGVCLGDVKATKKAIEGQDKYKKELIRCLSWFRENRHSHFVIEEDGFIIINMEDNIMPSVTGTFASMLSKSKKFKSGKLIMTMAQTIENTTKISLRIAGMTRTSSLDLRSIIHQIITVVGGESGGHQLAAGAIIKTDDEAKFLEVAKEILRKCAIEEVIR